ncbi:galactose oxidase [Lojkania enalia]|uniref:Galactose oxidase n=1 Tax=Lojkania enalia TaxID=147567 RepID=A0A9P4K431_9PLEO|nr:galactose oxidase [Didymosphaeria enalia]
MPAIANPKATWSCLLRLERLRRSSQVLSVINEAVCIFGGEVLPRQPVDNHIDIISLAFQAPDLDTKTVASAPSPRVGSASTVLNGKMYVFSGRGGTDMAPVEEHGALWCFDPVPLAWTKVEPADPTQPYPPARSYHCATSDGQGTLFIHAGCPAKGRLSDFWKFDISTNTWTQVPDAPPPQRGGTSIAYSNGKLYRMNGFDGIKEQGGSLDIFDIATNAWSTETFNADGSFGPEPRSVCALLALKIQGRDKLITLFGERDPSALGHAGAGKMLGDVWTYDIVENWWTKVDCSACDSVPEPRGWFAADLIKGQDGMEKVIVHGGLGENNERLADVWLLELN